MDSGARSNIGTRPVSRLVHVGLFSIAASIGMVFALLAEIQDAHHLSGTDLGVIAAVSFFAGVASQTLLAPLADRGHARHLMIAAVAAAAIGALGFALSSSAWQFIAARALSGAAFGAYAPAARAVVSAADPTRAGARLGGLAGLETAGFILGPGLAAGVVEIAGVDAPFLIISVILVLLVMPISRIDIHEAQPDTAPTSRWSGVSAILRRRRARSAIILSAALILPAGMYEAIFARFMTDIGAETWFIGLSLSLYGIPFALTAPIAGRMVDRIGPLRVVPVSVLFIVPLTAIYGQLTTPGLVMMLASIEAVANGAALPATQAMMAACTTDGERATGQGLVGSAGQIAAGFAALTAAPLYEGHGPEITFAMVAVAVLALSAIGVVVGLSRGEPDPLEQPHNPDASHTPEGGRSPDPSPA